jgi:hypothetical protein
MLLVKHKGIMSKTVPGLRQARQKKLVGGTQAKEECAESKEGESKALEPSPRRAEAEVFGLTSCQA